MAAGTDHRVSVPIDGDTLDGELVVPAGAAGLVTFATGQASGRADGLAPALRDRGFATLVFDLLTEHEGRVPRAQFDVTLLTTRLVAATGWLRDREETADLPLGYVGSDTGAAAALSTAARLGDEVGAVVSRGGRVDLATERLADVTAPTLFVVDTDAPTLDLNRTVRDELGGPSELAVVDGAAPGFGRADDATALADLLASWFDEHLG